jgi:hypothetical protein
MLPSSMVSLMYRHILAVISRVANLRRHTGKMIDDTCTMIVLLTGSQMAPEVFFTVCYRYSTVDIALLKNLHAFHPAILHGYCRR